MIARHDRLSPRYRRAAENSRRRRADFRQGYRAAMQDLFLCRARLPEPHPDPSVANRREIAHMMGANNKE